MKNQPFYLLTRSTIKKRNSKEILVGGLVAIFYFPIQLGISNHPLIDELIFFRGVASLNHQAVMEFIKL